jgi:hypothetical protein
MKRQAKPATEVLEHGVSEDQRTEEELSEEEKGKGKARDNPIVRLKNEAGSMPWSTVRVLQTHLYGLLERHPGYFNALIALAEGRGQDIPKESLRFLRENRYISKDNTPLDNVKLVLQAALRRVDDGTTIVDPIAFKDKSEVETLETIEKRREEEGQKKLDGFVNKLEERREKGPGSGVGPIP